MVKTCLIIRIYIQTIYRDILTYFGPQDTKLFKAVAQSKHGVPFCRHSSKKILCKQKEHHHGLLYWVDYWVDHIHQQWNYRTLIVYAGYAIIGYWILLMIYNGIWNVQVINCHIPFMAVSEIDAWCFNHPFWLVNSILSLGCFFAVYPLVI